MRKIGRVEDDSTEVLHELHAPSEYSLEMLCTDWRQTLRANHLRLP